MPKEMVISANPHETRVAIIEEGQLCEYYVEREKEFALVGSIYKGRVTRVLPGMQSAFVQIGLDSDAFLYVSDFLEGIEEFDAVVHTVEEKVEKMEAQGGEVFPATGAVTPALEPTDVEAMAAAPGGEGAAPPYAAPAVSPAPVPASHAPAPGRDRFENRPREGRRDFGRRGGRGADASAGAADAVVIAMPRVNSRRRNTLRPARTKKARPNRFSPETPLRLFCRESRWRNTGKNPRPPLRRPDWLKKLCTRRHRAPLPSPCARQLLRRRHPSSVRKPQRASSPCPARRCPNGVTNLPLSPSSNRRRPR